MNKLIAALNAIVGLAVLLYYAFESYLGSLELWGILSWPMLILALLAFYKVIRIRLKDGRYLMKILVTVMAAFTTYHTLGQAGFDAPTWDVACVLFGVGIGLGGLKKFRSS